MRGKKAYVVVSITSTQELTRNRCIILRPLAVVTLKRVDQCGHNVWRVDSGLRLLRVCTRIVGGLNNPWKHDDRSLEVEGEWGIPVWSNIDSLCKREITIRKSDTMKTARCF